MRIAGATHLTFLGHAGRMFGLEKEAHPSLRLSRLDSRNSSRPGSRAHMRRQR
jgi:hypothetical protein